MRTRSTGVRVHILGPLAAASDPLWLEGAPYLFLSVRMCGLAWEAYETGGGPLTKAEVHVGLQWAYSRKVRYVCMCAALAGRRTGPHRDTAGQTDNFIGLG